MKNLFSVLILLAAFWMSCTESGIVGESFLPTDVDVRIDTLFVEDAESIQIPAFSTTSTYLSSGRYADALFGEHNVASYFLPRIGTTNYDTLIVDSLRMTMRFRADLNQLYGDTTQNVTFGLFQIQEEWRAGTMRHSRALATEADPIVSFEFNGEASYTIDMPREYIESFVQYESLPDTIRQRQYIEEYLGLALKPVGDANLIVPFFEDSVRVDFFESPSDSVVSTLRGAIRAAYSAVVENRPAPPSNVSLLRFDWTDTYSYPFYSRLAELGPFNLSSTFLEINPATEALENSLPTNHVRPRVTTLRTYIRRPAELDFSLVGEAPDFNLNFIDTLGYFVYNVAPINEWKNNFNIDTTQQFYTVPNFENGLLYNTAILNEVNPRAIKPRFVITRVEPIGATEEGSGS